MGWTGCVRREKFRRDFVALTLHQFGSFCTEFCNATERFQMHKNSMKQYQTWVLGPMGGWVRSLQKILTRLYGTNFCTTSARFAPSFVRQPNGHKCIQIVQYTLKHEFRVQWGGSGSFVAKNSVATKWHELLHQFSPFWTECGNATNCPKCTQIVRNATKHEVMAQWGGSSGLLWKIPTRLHSTNFCTTSARFAPSFCKVTKRYQMHPNSMKHTKTWV